MGQILSSHAHAIMSSSVGVTPFTAANRARVASLYKRALKLSRDWIIQRDQWRIEALDIRRRFEQNMHVRNPRLVENLLNQASAELERMAHPDPYIVSTAPGGTKWERNARPMVLKADPELEA